MRRSRMMLRTLSDRTTAGHNYSDGGATTKPGAIERTLIFSDVLESKRRAVVFPLDYADLSEGTLSDNAQQAKVAEIDCCKRESARNSRKQWDFREGTVWPTEEGGG